MNRTTFALSSARHYWRTHLGVLAGAVLAGAVLVGALLVGDSVDYSLRRFALQRLGDTSAVLNAQGRFFSAELAAHISRELNTRAAAVLNLRGIAIMGGSGADERRQVNRIEVLGVDDDFWQLDGKGAEALEGNSIALSTKLAAALNAQVGDEVSLRIGRPGLMPRDAPLASRREGLTERATFKVQRIVPDDRLGRFSMAANQIAPYNAFISLKRLQQMAGLEGRANLLPVALRDGSEIPVEKIDAALRRVWQIGFAGIELREFDDPALLQLQSNRIFLDQVTSRAALEVDPGSPAVGVLTYMVNSISAGSGEALRSTPYSFVNALSPSESQAVSPIPAAMPDNGIIINEWLARQLAVTNADIVTVKYYELMDDNSFEERARDFSVHAVLPMEAFAHERTLMPEFPGLTDVDSCREWDIGMPMDEELLRDEANEEYWDNYRQTPKALLTLAAGQAMWANRFGNLTSVRYERSDDFPAEQIQTLLTQEIDPAGLGLFFLPVRELALRAVTEAMSFAELFLSMSFFLIIAALMLTGLMFVFSIERRAVETGTLLAVGYRPRQIAALYIIEGAILAGIGSLAGAYLGIHYTRFLIWGLSTYWQGAIAGAAIQYHGEWSSVISGVLAGFVCGTAAVAIVLRKQVRRPATELISGGTTSAPLKSGLLRGTKLTSALAIAGTLAALIIMWQTITSAPEHATTAFFGAGALLLTSGIIAARNILGAIAQSAAGSLSLPLLALRNAARRRGRSLAAIGLLACGCFMVLAVGSMKEDVAANTDQRWSGSGGFALFGETTIPLTEDLNTDKGQRAFNLHVDRRLSEKELSFVQIKVFDGDDASCFNLNRAQAPRLLGLMPAEMSARKAFLPRRGNDDFWQLLDLDLPDGVIPGLVGDSDTAMWGLQRKTGVDDGDVLNYRDERGEIFQVKLVGTIPVRLSVFQGNVLISAAHFTGRFPSEDGYRMLLVDTAHEDAQEVMNALAQRLEIIGLDLTTTGGRMLEFYGVQSTYLTMFLVLGGMGLLLGSAGLGIVVLRNVMDRRAELALLKALGYRHNAIRNLVLLEHAMLLAAGLLIGTFAAVIAVLPSLTAPGADVSIVPLLLTLAGIIISALLWTVLATIGACRGDLLPALRSE